MDRTRRRLLQGLGGATVAAIAGCTESGDDGNGTDPANGSTPDAPNGTDGDATEPTNGSEDGGETRSPTDAEGVARQFVQHLFAGENEAAQSLFVEAYRRRATPAILERMRLGFDVAGGGFQGIESAETGVRSGLTAVDLTLQLERTTAPLRVTVTDEVAIRSAVIAGEYERASYADPTSFDATDHALEPGGCQLGATVTTPTDVEEAPASCSCTAAARPTVT